MPVSPGRHRRSVLAFVLLLIVAAATARLVAAVYPFASPVFGLSTAPDGNLVVADAGAGVLEIRDGQLVQVAQLPGVTDVAPIGRGDMFAITSLDFGGEGSIYRVSRGSIHELADLYAFELEVNPDGNPVAPPPAPPPSNPFDVAALNGGRALVADAAGNSLLIVDQRGNVDWIATVPNELVSTDNAKAIFGCPGPGGCGLPDMLPAQGVATSVAIGPDGAYYVGELKGFPAPTGESRVWRIQPGTRHAVCGTDPGCEMVGDGFTSIIDLTFGPDGTLYVVELDEASWLALEEGVGIGGSVNACSVNPWSCQQIATGLFMVTSATVGRDGTVSVVTNALIPGGVDISALP